MAHCEKCMRHAAESDVLLMPWIAKGCYIKGRGDHDGRERQSAVFDACEIMASCRQRRTAKIDMYGTGEITNNAVIVLVK